MFYLTMHSTIVFVVIILIIIVIIFKFWKGFCKYLDNIYQRKKAVLNSLNEPIVK